MQVQQSLEIVGETYLMIDSKTERDVFADLKRTIRVSDQSCTAYAVLRDRYRRRSTLLDVIILLLSAWLTAMVWVQPAIADQLTLFKLSRDIWLGLLSVGTFGLSLVQLQVNWKGRATSYRQALAVLSTYVKELRPLRAAADPTKIEAALERYQAITEPLEPIPEAEFLALKQRHLLKMQLSQYLDEHPGTSLWLMRWKLRWHDSRAMLCADDRGKTP